LHLLDWNTSNLGDSRRYKSSCRRGDLQMQYSDGSSVCTYQPSIQSSRSSRDQFNDHGSCHRLGRFLPSSQRSNSDVPREDVTHGLGVSITFPLATLCSISALQKLLQFWWLHRGNDRTLVGRCHTLVELTSCTGSSYYHSLRTVRCVALRSEGRRSNRGSLERRVYLS